MLYRGCGNVFTKVRENRILFERFMTNFTEHLDESRQMWDNSKCEICEVILPIKQ